MNTKSKGAHIKRLTQNKLRIGLALIILSGAPWAAIPFSYFICPSLNAAQKTAFVGFLIVLAEVLFWPGVLLCGRETWTLIRKHGWRETPRRLLRAFISGKIDTHESLQ